jgi:outer membrane lipopolysaccharide assembly protein LptE/RlpB
MWRSAGAGLALAVALLCLGCGYRVLGQGADGARPLWIAPVEDDAAEPLFGILLGQHLSREAVDRAQFALAGVDRADLVLRVQVQQVNESGAAFVVGDRTREYLLAGTVGATLTRRDGEILWKAGAIRADRPFAAGVDVNQTERNKDVASELLARDLGREVLRRVAAVAAGIAP